MVLRIVADDLTGALDTAAPFAAASAPLPVRWDRAVQDGSYALDTETRERSTDTCDWVEHLLGAALSFKKIDSLLRGRTAEEVSACLEGGRFRSAIIAPAFPAQGRLTRDGRQYWRAPDHSWEPVACDLLAALRANLPIDHAGSAAAIGGSGYVFCDAEGEADLRAIVAAGRRMAAPVLWCGSAGLARVLAGPPRSLEAFVPMAPLLMLIGSDHAASRAQHEAIAARNSCLVTQLGAIPIEKAVADAAAAIGRGIAAVLAVDLPTGSPEAAREVLTRTFALVAEQMPRPGSLLVTGGETLYGLLQALGATSLLATGELMPGVPHARVAGGRWQDLAVISKSGGFGAPDLLIRLAESVMP